MDSDGTKKTTKFNYPEVVGNHFLFQHSVDDHNNKRHSPISLEVVRGTKYWPNHVFAFLLAVTEVNVNLAAQKLWWHEANWSDWIQEVVGQNTNIQLILWWQN